jgi:hypothetical protein
MISILMHALAAFAIGAVTGAVVGVVAVFTLACKGVIK